MSVMPCGGDTLIQNRFHPKFFLLPQKREGPSKVSQCPMPGLGLESFATGLKVTQAVTSKIRKEQPIFLFSGVESLA